ncbi:unnamed protein product [Symbiodinium microadriaticum]|nr:unnamed protein product [Symbiodinium microadriaticum]
MPRLLLRCLLLWPSLVAALQSAISSLGQKAASSANATTPCLYRHVPRDCTRLPDPEKSWRSGLPTQERKITGGEPKAELKMRKLKNVARLAGNAELLVKAIQQDPLLKQLAINSPVVAHVIGSLHALKKMFSQEVLSKLRSGQVPEDASAQAVPDLAFTKRRVIGPQPEDPTLVSLKVGRSRQRQQPGISSGPRSENSEILLERELRLLDYIYADLLGSFWQTLLTLEAAQLVMAI